MLNDSTVSIVDAKYAHMKYGTTLVVNTIINFNYWSISWDIERNI